MVLQNKLIFRVIAWVVKLVRRINFVQTVKVIQIMNTVLYLRVLPQLVTRV
ncbi:hypothetical protein D1872_344890 [compost metagenome]